MLCACWVVQKQVLFIWQISKYAGISLLISSLIAISDAVKVRTRTFELFAHWSLNSAVNKWMIFSKYQLLLFKFSVQRLKDLLNSLFFQILDHYEKFLEYDKNGDGSLDLTEVRNCFPELYHDQCTD